MKMINSSDYFEKIIWTNRFKDFTIEVCRVMNIDNKYDWFIYAYIYDKHKIFDKIIGESIYNMMPKEFGELWHCGISYNKWYYDEKGKCVNKVLGSDYQHAYDHFGHSSYAEHVFEDAERIAEYLLQFDEVAE